ncbi:DUF6507 family protein [Falsarthrobacter nasiphocae]|uniref:Uncharacterized protein n=1 Tax=Falsarthrobacter nasiphocae TaxID=189863 RepID=A0AAE3YF33_9MICC|nr:DUF6507 family protein [Falsarthrobacter nasiphocae]MDR6892229.1 hypothetical protein [Falsarthrobacter nasiphocae]
MKYDISVPGCNSVITNVVTESKPFETASKGMAKDVPNAAKASRSGIVGKALIGYYERSFGKDVESIATLTGNGTTKLSEALTEFQQGDETMVQRSVTSIGHTESKGDDAPGAAKGGAAQSAGASDHGPRKDER